MSGDLLGDLLGVGIIASMAVGLASVVIHHIHDDAPLALNPPPLPPLPPGIQLRRAVTLDWTGSGMPPGTIVRNFSTDGKPLPGHAWLDGPDGRPICPSGSIITEEEYIQGLLTVVALHRSDNAASPDYSDLIETAIRAHDRGEIHARQATSLPLRS